MELTPEDLERAEFDSTDNGFDPDAVRDLLRRAAARMRALEREGVKSVSESVSAVLEQAVKSGEELVAAATTDADAIRSAAEGDAERIAEDAAARADEILATADENVRERTTQVINEAQQRLDRLLAAERDVHDRLQTAMTDIQASVSRVGVNQPEALALTVEDPDGDVSWADKAAEQMVARRKSA